MNLPPSLQSVLPSIGNQNEATANSEGIVVSRLYGSAAGQVQTLDNYSFVITPRVVAPFSTMVGKKKIVTDPSRGRVLLPYPPFETLASSPAERTRGIDNHKPYYVILANVAKLSTLTLDLYGETFRSFPLGSRPSINPLPVLMDRFISENESDSEEREVVMDSIGTLILVDLLRSCVQREIASPARYPGMKKVLRFIRENFDSNIPVSDLASIAGLSQQHFIVIFRDITGYTPHAYLRATRLKTAAKLLQQGFDVTTTCFRVGFRSLSGFEQAFFRTYGVLPKAYQRRL